MKDKNKRTERQGPWGGSRRPRAQELGGASIFPILFFRAAHTLKPLTCAPHYYWRPQVSVLSPSLISVIFTLCDEEGYQVLQNTTGTSPFCASGHRGVLWEGQISTPQALSLARRSPGTAAAAGVSGPPRLAKPEGSLYQPQKPKKLPKKKKRIIIFY